jgi:hypothetical protein
VIDVKNAQYSGLIAESTAKTPGSAAEAMLFDAYNPWAPLVQLNSTHPLTGRRVAHLGAIARERGKVSATTTSRLLPSACSSVAEGCGGGSCSSFCFCSRRFS